MVAKIVVKARVSPYYWDLVKMRLGMEKATDTMIIQELINRALQAESPKQSITTFKSERS